MKAARISRHGRLVRPIAPLPMDDWHDSPTTLLDGAFLAGLRGKYARVGSFPPSKNGIDILCIGFGKLFLSYFRVLSL